MTAVDPDDLAAEIRDRIAAKVAASVARREARRQVRSELAERRAAGLRQRHAAKLDRKEPASVPPGSLRAAGRVRRADSGNRGVPGPDERARLRDTLGAALRRQRAARHLSQRTLAALAGCHPSTVERLEAGQRRPSSAMLAALATALACPPGWSVAGRREQVEVLLAELVAAAGESLVESTTGGARRRRRRLRKARLVANHAALPALRARHHLLPQRQAARFVPAEVAAAVRSYR